MLVMALRATPFPAELGSGGLTEDDAQSFTRAVEDLPLQFGSLIWFFKVLRACDDDFVLPGERR